MVVSVVLPTRMRAAALERSLDSLGEGNYEVLLAVDRDDPTEYRGFAARRFAVERYGYAGLDCYYNLLAEHAKGDWVLLWNDDALMQTPDWVDIVADHEPNAVLSPDTVHRPLCTFPIIPRRFIEAAGHMSLSPHVDSWWEQIGQMLDRLVWPPISVAHDRADVTGNNDDTVYREREYRSEEFEQMRFLRERDAETIRALL